MRPDIKFKKYTTEYDTIAKMYEELPSLPKICAKLGITIGHYYQVCKFLNKTSIASKFKIEEQTNEQNSTPE